MAMTLEAEIDRNFDYFQRHLSSFVANHRGQFALLRDANVVDFLDSIIDAERKGTNHFPDGRFSIQEVTDQPADLGFFTHAFDQRET